MIIVASNFSFEIILSISKTLFITTRFYLFVFAKNYIIEIISWKKFGKLKD